MIDPDVPRSSSLSDYLANTKSSCVKSTSNYVLFSRINKLANHLIANETELAMRAFSIETQELWRMKKMDIIDRIYCSLDRMTNKNLVKCWEEIQGSPEAGLKMIVELKKNDL